MLVELKYHFPAKNKTYSAKCMVGGERVYTSYIQNTVCVYIFVCICLYMKCIHVFALGNLEFTTISMQSLRCDSLSVRDQLQMINFVCGSRRLFYDRPERTEKHFRRHPGSLWQRRTSGNANLQSETSTLVQLHTTNNLCSH